MGDPSITFKEEVEHLDLDHDDALIISLGIANTLVKRIILDMHNFVNVIYYVVF